MQEGIGAHRHQQRQQGGDHPSLGGAGVLQGQGLEDEVQAGLAGGQAEQVLPVAGTIADASTPAPGEQEHQAAQGHAGEDHPQRRQLGEGPFQGDKGTAPQRHGHDQADHCHSPALPAHRSLHAKTGV
ncbi:hypothetical protein D3C71_1860290 [compost metagenome]